VRQQLLDLNELQKIDLTIREMETRRETIPKHLHELEASIGELRGELSQLTTEDEGLGTEVRTLEGTVKAEAEKIRKWERRLADIRNQREYLALSREVEGSKRANRDMEEQILELMGKQEELRARIEGLQDKLAEQDVDCEAERSRVGAEVQGMEEGEASQRARREALLPNIPKALLRKYEGIRKKRLGLGLVPAVDGSCQGCNMRLPPQLYNILQRGDSIEQCPSCQRIVYWEGIIQAEGQEQGTVEVTA